MPDELRSADGRVLASVEPDRTTADDAVARYSAVIRAVQGADCVEIANAVVASFGDWQITVDDERVAAALMDLDEVLVRHAHLMTLDLTRRDPMPRAHSSARAPSDDAITILSLRSDPDRYTNVLMGAYPVGHVDHDAAELLPGGARHTMASYLSGSVIGPMRWDASCEAVYDDDVIGFIVIATSASGRLFPGGPWVTDIAVDPRLHGRGVGRALLTHAIAALVAAGDVRLGLAVSHGNRARDLYARLGFVEIFESWRFMIGA